jgi:hypothetical protein
VVLEDDHGPVCLVLVAPLFSGGDEHAGGFEHAKGQAKRSSVSDNFVGSSREPLDFLDALPEFFDGVLWLGSRLWSTVRDYFRFPWGSMAAQVASR